MTFNDVSTPTELLEFMNNNITYGFIGKNKKVYLNPNSPEWNDWYNNCLVQTGKQVLKSKVGTCWDQVELERLWFLKHHYEFKTIFMWFEFDHDNNYPTHSFLAYKDHNKWYWFENAFFDYQGIHEFDLYDELIEYVKGRHLDNAINNKVAKIKDYKYINCYEYTKLENPLNVDDYINHVLNGKKIK